MTRYLTASLISKREIHEKISLSIYIFLINYCKCVELGGTTISKTMMANGYDAKIFIQAEGEAVRDGSHCHNNSSWDYVLSTEDGIGKQMLSQLLMAFAAKKTIKRIGSDVCIVNGNIEELTRLEIY